LRDDEDCPPVQLGQGERQIAAEGRRRRALRAICAAVERRRVASRRVARYKSPQESLATSFPYSPFPRRLFLFRVSDRGAEAQSVVGMVAGRFVFFYCSLG